MTAIPAVPVSWGELIDKITILEIKLARIAEREAHAHVAKEYALLLDLAADGLRDDGVASLVAQLRAVNQELWEIEDSIRDAERAALFGDDFIRLARSVYQTNDRRAALKRSINLLPSLRTDRGEILFGRQRKHPSAATLIAPKAQRPVTRSTSAAASPGSSSPRHAIWRSGRSR